MKESIFKTWPMITSAIVLFFVGATSYYYYPLISPAPSLQAVALIRPTQNNQAAGIVRFKQTNKGLKIKAEITGLTPGEHGFHVHEFGNCQSSDGSSAGGHFNPTGMPHAGPCEKRRHIGDLGNIYADQNGIGRYKACYNDIALDGADGILGKSVIVHEKVDDLVSQPTGAAGARIGCGVIELEK